MAEREYKERLNAQVKKLAARPTLTPVSSPENPCATLREASSRPDTPTYNPKVTNYLDPRKMPIARAESAIVNRFGSSPKPVVTIVCTEMEFRGK